VVSASLKDITFSYLKAKTEIGVVQNNNLDQNAKTVARPYVTFSYSRYNALVASILTRNGCFNFQ